MTMLKLNIQNETSKLKAVILGTAKSNGPTPKIEDCYDPKSIQHVLAGTYPKEADMIEEMEEVAAVLLKYDVKVFRPEIIENYNQIFSRDIGFVVEDKFITSNILPDRDKEIHAIHEVLDERELEKKKSERSTRRGLHQRRGGRRRDKEQ